MKISTKSWRYRRQEIDKSMAVVYSLLTDRGGGEASVYALLRSIRYNATHGSQDRPLHERLQLIERDASAAIAAIEAATPPAPSAPDRGLNPPPERERDMLAEAIRNAAVKRGIVREDASLTGPMLLLLCEDLAQEPSAPVGVAERVRGIIALLRQPEPDNGEKHTEHDEGYDQASREIADMLERALTPPAAAPRVQMNNAPQIVPAASDEGDQP